MDFSESVQPPVRLVIDNDIAHLHFRYPMRNNGLDTESIPKICEAVGHANETPSLRFLVVHGYAGRFCIGGSGEHIRFIIGRPYSERVALIQDVQRVILTLLRCRLFTVACVDGLAAGAGADLMLASDLSLAGPSARVSFLYSKLGLVPDTGFGLLERRLKGSMPLVLYAESEILRNSALQSLGLAEAVSEAELEPVAVAKMLRRRFRHDSVAYAATKEIEVGRFMERNAAHIRAAAERQADMLGRIAVQERVLRSSALQNAN